MAVWIPALRIVLCLGVLAALAFYCPGFVVWLWSSIARHHITTAKPYKKSGVVFENVTAVLTSFQSTRILDGLGLMQSLPFVVKNLGFMNLDMSTDKGTFHGYNVFYDVLLKPYMDLENVTVLEVGVKNGGSLILWRELFGSNSWIYGIDVDESVPMFPRDPRIKVIAGLDTTDYELVWNKFEGITFDIIIDDGSHLARHQVATMRGLWRHLSPRGIYIIEDVYKDCYVMRNSWVYMGGNVSRIGSGSWKQDPTVDWNNVEEVRVNQGGGASLAVHLSKGDARLFVFRPATSLAVASVQPVNCTMGFPGSAPSCVQVGEALCPRRYGEACDHVRGSCAGNVSGSSSLGLSPEVGVMSV